MKNPATRYAKYLELATEAASVEEFRTKAAKKDAMLWASIAYDEIKSWDIDAPYALAHLREKHIALFGDNADKAAALLALRDKIKSIPVAAKVAKETKEQAVARMVATSEGVAAINTAFEDIKPLMISNRTAAINFAVDRANETVSKPYDWRKAERWETNARNHAERVLSVVAHAGGVEALATRQISDEIASYTHKLALKVGDITDVVVDNHAQVGAFRIRGKRGDDKVVVEQQVITKFTGAGMPFNQYPARIYINDKFTPAAEY